MNPSIGTNVSDIHICNSACRIFCSNFITFQEGVIWKYLAVQLEDDTDGSCCPESIDLEGDLSSRPVN